MPLINLDQTDQEGQKCELANHMLILNKVSRLFKTNRIMVIDDEEFCLMSIKVILKQIGFDVDYQVDFCIQGQEAIQTI